MSSSQRLLTVPIEQLRPDSQQPRRHFDGEALRSLAASLAVSGQEQPVIAWGSEPPYTLLDGERRWRAASLAGMTSLQALIEEHPPDEAAMLTRQLTLGIQHENLSPIEQARGIERLIAVSGRAASAVGSSLGLSPSQVCRLRGLLQLPEDIQARVASGELAPSVALGLRSVDDTDARAQLATEASSGLLTREELVRKVKRLRRNTGSAKRAAAIVRLKAALGSGRSITVAGRGLDLALVIDMLDGLLAQARRAAEKGLTLSALVNRLHEAKPAAETEVSS